mgnify:CR=1 FL=1
MPAKKPSKFRIDTKYHTLNEGIPQHESGNDRTCIGMDTGNHREWLHLWIGKHVLGKSDLECDTTFESMSVLLSRKDAMNLVEEINHRLF